MEPQCACTSRYASVGRTPNYDAPFFLVSHGDGLAARARLGLESYTSDPTSKAVGRGHP